jgi:hypothetical protein
MCEEGGFVERELENRRNVDTDQEDNGAYQAEF